MKNKYILQLTIAGLFCALFASCGTSGDKNNAALPQRAKEFIQTYFPEESIEAIEESKNQMYYEVALSDGTEIEFSSTGEWEEIDFKKSDVKESFLKLLPEKIVEKIAEETSSTLKKVEKKMFRRTNYIYRITFNKPSNLELNFTSDGDLISDLPEDNKLPSAANAFLNKHFSDISILSVVRDVDGDFDVVLEDKTSICFDRKGNWTDVKITKKKQLPESLVESLPSALNRHIEKNYPEQYIRRIERKSYGYRVRLNKPNNVELSFSNSGVIIATEDSKNDNQELQ